MARIECIKHLYTSVDEGELLISCYSKLHTTYFEGDDYYCTCMHIPYVVVVANVEPTFQSIDESARSVTVCVILNLQVERAVVLSLVPQPLSAQG